MLSKPQLVRKVYAPACVAGCQTMLSIIPTAEGLDGASLAMRTTDGFSLQDHTHWLHELHCGLRSVLEGVTIAMETLEYTTEGVSKLKAAWQSEHKGMEGEIE